MSKGKRNRAKRCQKVCPDCTGSVIFSIKIPGHDVPVTLVRHDVTCPLANYTPGEIFYAPNGNVIKVAEYA